MREAVIVSYARTGLAKSGRGGFNITPPMSLAAPRHPARGRARRRREGLCRGLLSRQLRPWRAEHRPPGRAARRPAEVDGRRLGEPLLLLGPADHRDGRQLDPLRTAPTASSPAASRASRFRRRLAEGIDRSGAAQGRARHLHGDDRYRRHRRRALQAQPRIPGRVSRWSRSAAWPPRSRPNKFKDEIVPMKTKMKVVDKATKAEIDRRLRRRPRRVQPPRDHAGRPRQARAGEGPGASSSPPATPASSPTAPPPWC